MKINSTTKIVGLLGHPVKQSFSPNIHNYLFEKYNLNNIYCCFDVEQNKLNECVNGIKALGIEGCNVTVPHKVEIIKYLDNIEKSAKLIGAVNTIRNENNTLKGYNTDGVGFIKSILDKGYKLQNKNVMLIGAGGACRSISIELANSGVSTIEIRNRSIDKANELVSTINNNFNVQASCSDKTIDELDLNNIDILINTTPIGMESDLCPVDENITIDKELIVCDIVYKPYNTSFIKWAQRNNLKVVHGIDMLINQALYSFSIWTGIATSEEDEKYLKQLYIDNSVK